MPSPSRPSIAGSGTLVVVVPSEPSQIDAPPGRLPTCTATYRLPHWSSVLKLLASRLPDKRNNVKLMSLTLPRLPLSGMLMSNVPFASP